MALLTMSWWVRQATTLFPYGSTHYDSYGFTPTRYTHHGYTYYGRRCSGPSRLPSYHPTQAVQRAIQSNARPIRIPAYMTDRIVAIRPPTPTPTPSLTPTLTPALILIACNLTLALPLTRWPSGAHPNPSPAPHQVAIRRTRALAYYATGTDPAEEEIAGELQLSSTKVR